MCDLSQFPEKTDFYKFYKSAGFFKEGKSIYTPVPFTPDGDSFDKFSEKAKKTMNMLHPNMNAPFHTLFILPLEGLPFGVAFGVWSIFSLCLSLAAAGLIAYSRPFNDYKKLKSGFINRQGSVEDTSTSVETGNLSDERIISPGKKLFNAHAADVLILWIITLLSFVTWVNIASGQFGLFLMGAIVFVWLSARKEKYQLAGIILGIALSVKIFLGLFLIFFAVQRRWKVLLWAIAVFILCNIISLSVFGLSAYKQYMELVAASHLYINASWNASFTAFFTRIFGGAENIPLIRMPVVAYGLACFFSFLLIIGLIRTAWLRQRDVSPQIRFDIGYALTIAAMLLISPFGWMYYFPPLIITLLVIWNASSVLKAGWLYKFMAAGAWILTCPPIQLINSEEIAMNNPDVWFTTCGYYFYALIIFCVLLLIMSHQFNRMKTEGVQSFD